MSGPGRIIRMAPLLTGTPTCPVPRLLAKIPDQQTTSSAWFNRPRRLFRTSTDLKSPACETAGIQIGSSETRTLGFCQGSDRIMSGHTEGISKVFRLRDRIGCGAGSPSEPGVRCRLPRSLIQPKQTPQGRRVVGTHAPVQPASMSRYTLSPMVS